MFSNKRLTEIEDVTSEKIATCIVWQDKIIDRLDQLEGHLELSDGNDIKTYYCSDIHSSKVTHLENENKELKETIDMILSHLKLEIKTMPAKSETKKIVKKK